MAVAATENLGPSELAAGQVGLQRLDEPALCSRRRDSARWRQGGEALDAAAGGLAVLLQIEDERKDWVMPDALGNETSSPLRRRE